MAQFASAAFTGTAFTELSAADGNWSKQSGYTSDLILGSTGAYCINNTGALAAVYRHSATPSNADYTVSADITKLSGSTPNNWLGVCGRMASGAATLYYALYAHSSTNIRLFKVVAGTQTQLGSSYSYTLTGTTAQLRLRMSGSSISVELDGATVIGPVTDTAITAAGAAGIYGFANRETGVADAASLDNFSGDDITPASDLGGTITLSDFTLSGAFATGAASALSGSISLDDFSLSGFLGLAPGRIDTAPFKNWSGTLLPGVTVPNVVFLKLDRTLPLAVVSQVTAGDGVMTITNAALVTGTYYIMVSYDAAGANIGAELVLAT